ncbi:MAG: hypothetical protein L0I76_36770, partial [Pseudonocardia sp.]|nr:hypothetical protein [Pseudonocardia sp.]
MTARPPILRDADLPPGLLARAHGAAAELRGRGVRAGDRVAVDARLPGGTGMASPEATLAW